MIFDPATACPSIYMKSFYEQSLSKVDTEVYRKSKIRKGMNKMSMRNIYAESREEKSAEKVYRKKAITTNK